MARLPTASQWGIACHADFLIRWGKRRTDCPQISRIGRFILGLLVQRGAGTQISVPGEPSTFVGPRDLPNPHNLRRALLLQQGHHIRQITFPGDRHFLEASIGLFEILFCQLYR